MQDKMLSTRRNQQSKPLLKPLLKRNQQKKRKMPKLNPKRMMPKKLMIRPSQKLKPRLKVRKTPKTLCHQRLKSAWMMPSLPDYQHMLDKMPSSRRPPLSKLNTPSKKVSPKEKL